MSDDYANNNDYANSIDTRKNELMNLFNNKAPIAKTFGMTLSFNVHNQAIITLPYNPNLNHAAAGIHGGVYMTLLDSTAWFSAAVIHEEDCWMATSEMSVHFLAPSANTQLRAVGKIIKAGKRQDIVEATIYNENNDAVAHAVGTFILLPSVKKEPK
jgi:uncharacterized protein (TIGR00369 family)